MRALDNARDTLIAEKAAEVLCVGFTSVVSQKFVYTRDVIPAERAAARESRNPGKYKEKTRFPLSRE
jgi:hypothetical protein